MLSYSVHGSLSGSVNAPVSKSDLHRLIIACSLSGSDTEICRCTLSEDIKATARVMEAVGASIHFEENRILVEGIKLQPDTNVLCDCSESGSTLRFLVPVLAALGQMQPLPVMEDLPNARWNRFFPSFPLMESRFTRRITETLFHSQSVENLSVETSPFPEISAHSISLD